MPKFDPSGPPGWGLGWGLITHSRKNKTITVTEDIQISINIAEAMRAPSSRMTHLDQSRKETQKPTASIVNPKLEARIGNWNVRTMFETGKAGQVVREMERYKLDIRGISECRWRGSGDEETHQGGVAIMMSQQAAKCLMEWAPESSRIIRARIYSKYRKLTLIHVYSPTNDACVESRDDFYEQLESTMQKCNRNDTLLIIGDLNAKVGKGTTKEIEVLGQHGTGTRNEKGERLCEFCEMNGLVITGTIFLHKEIHKATWKSPNDRTKNQIDHTMIARNIDHQAWTL